MNVSTRDVGCAVHKAMVLNPSTCSHGLLVQWEATEWLLAEKLLLCTFSTVFESNTSQLMRAVDSRCSGQLGSPVSC